MALEAIDTFQTELDVAIQSCLNEPNLTIQKIQQQLGPLFADKSDAKKTQFEIAMGKHMLSLLEYDGNSEEYIMQARKRLEFILYCTDEGYCEEVLPLAAFEDLVDWQPIEVSMKLFEFFEKHKRRLLKGLTPNKGKGLVLLRLFNNLIRRAPKSNYSHFNGRVLIYLSNAFPLCERSGVNPRGECNSENITFYDETDDDQAYNTFWSLQNLLNNPVKLVESGEVDRALEDMRVVVNKFESACGEEQVVKSERMSMELDREEDAMDIDTDREKRKRDKEEVVVDNVPDKKQKLSNDDEGECEKEAYMHIPKYLPSIKLFEHEMKDAEFRKFILVQFLIILQYIRGCSSSERKFLEGARARIHPRMVPLSMPSISPKQEESIAELWTSITAQLENIPPHGKEFTERILHTLSREKVWIYWKFAQYCPDFSKSQPIPDLSKQFAERSARLCAPLGELPDIDWVVKRREMKNAHKIVKVPSLEECYEALKHHESDQEYIVKRWQTIRAATRNHVLLIHKKIEFGKPGDMDRLIEAVNKNPKGSLEGADENHTASDSIIVNEMGSPEHELDD